MIPPTGARLPRPAPHEAVVDGPTGERVTQRPTPRPYFWPAAVVFALSVPLFLIATNVLQVTNDLSFYNREFARYRVDQVTGMTHSQLQDVALAFIAFFGGRRDALDLQVEIRGSRRALFNARELAHMEDVFHLMQGVKAVQAASGLALVGVGALGFVLRRRAFLQPFGRVCLLGGGLTLAILLSLAALALVDFGDAFVRFHMMAFSNDLWILDPTRDHLLMLFPEGFWFDATMRIAGLTALEAAALAVLGAVLMRWAPPR